jgi:hypothetical protein
MESYYPILFDIIKHEVVWICAHLKGMLENNINHILEPQVITEAFRLKCFFDIPKELSYQQPVAEFRESESKYQFNQRLSIPNKTAR